MLHLSYPDFLLSFIFFLPLSGGYVEVPPPASGGEQAAGGAD